MEIHVPDHGYEEVRLVLLGKTGSGKSATGNTILGRNAFASKFSGSSNTHRCSHQTGIRFNIKIVVVDTPGIYDTEETHGNIQQEISKCIAFTSPGPHAFIFVLNIMSRFTQEDHNTINQYGRMFGESIFKFSCILFTRKDELERNHKDIQDFIKNSPPQLMSFIQKCGGRVFAFDNTVQGVKQSIQVEQLLSEVQENLKTNGCKYFTKEMYESGTTKEFDGHERDFHESTGMDVLHQNQELVSSDEEFMEKKNEEVERADRELITKKDKKFRDEVRKQIDETPLVSLRYINAVNGLFE